MTGRSLGRRGPSPPEDLFYIKPGNQSAGPGKLSCQRTLCGAGGRAPSTPLFRSVILNPAIPSNSMRTCRRPTWNIPTVWGPRASPRRGLDQLHYSRGIVSTRPPARATGAMERGRGQRARDRERHRVDGDGGLGSCTLYSIGVFNTGTMARRICNSAGRPRSITKTSAATPWMLEAVRGESPLLQARPIRHPEDVDEVQRAGSAAGTPDHARTTAAEDWTREFSFTVARSRHVDWRWDHGACGDHVRSAKPARVIVGLTGGTCGDWYAAYAFNPVR